MFGSTVLDVAVGLVFVFLVLGLVCTAVNEYISQVLSLRGENLYYAVQGLFRGKYATLIAHDIFDHSLIRSVCPKGRPRPAVNPAVASATTPTAQDSGADPNSAPAETFRPNGLPSYLPSQLFSLALSDLLGLTAPTKTADGVETSTVSDLSAKVKASPYNKDGQLFATLQPLLAGAGNDIDLARKHIELWYEAAMDRAGGWYKKKIQLVSLCVAFGIALVANADALMIFERLWTSPAQRQALEVQAHSTGQPPATTAQLSTASEVAVSNLLGWNGPINPGNKSYNPTDPNRFPRGFEWFYKLIGLMATAYAASLGAPFWFDVLNRCMNIRGSGNAPAAGPPPGGGITSKPRVQGGEKP